MDTNLVALLVQLAASKGDKGSNDTMIILFGMVITALLPTLAAVAAYLKALTTAKTVEKVHVAVNSERTAMLEEVKKLRDDILNISKDKAKLEQKQQSSEITATHNSDKKMAESAVGAQLVEAIGSVSSSIKAATDLAKEAASAKL